MVDIDNKIYNSTQEKEQNPQLPLTSTAAPKDASKGEKWFDWIAYKGLTFWVNTGVSILITDYVTHGRGRAGLDSLIRPTAKGLHASGIIKNPQTAYKQTKTALETAALLSGGWILLAPLKVMEDNKRPLVHWLNKRMGVQEVDKSGRELSADEIYLQHEQPKQSWGNALSRRLVATGAVMATGSILDHTLTDKSRTKQLNYRFMGKHYQEQVHIGGKERVTKYVTEKITAVANAVAGKEKFGKDLSSTRQRWLNIAVLDSVFTGITASIMYATNGSKKTEHGHEKGNQSDPIGSQHAPSSVMVSPPNKNFAAPLWQKKRIGEDKENTDALTYAQRVLVSQDTPLQQGL